MTDPTTSTPTIAPIWTTWSPVYGRLADMEGDLQVALRAAVAGAAVGLRYFAALADLPVRRKADGSVVTEADRAVESAIRDVLGAARPGDAILGEEAGNTGIGPRQWIIDPIDGTASFIAGEDRWLVLVALVVAGEVMVGVAVVPAQRKLWWARRGGGAFEADLYGGRIVGERRVRVGDGRGSGRYAVIPETPRPQAHRLIAPLTAAQPWRIHPALLVARGDLDFAVQPQGQIWDFAATTVIVEEAGGQVTPLDGRPEPTGGPVLFARSTADTAAALTEIGPDSKHRP